MPTRHGDAPLIVTARFETSCFEILDDLRRRHFPAQLNRVPAHISLFHALPGDAVEEVVDTTMALCRRFQGFDLLPLGLRFLGRGVAIGYAGGDLVDIRGTLARAWADWLVPQDRQTFKPHVTIQNKVAPEQARALLSVLEQTELPTCRVDGLSIWRYLGGPWAKVADCPLQSNPPTRVVAAGPRRCSLDCS